MKFDFCGHVVTMMSLGLGEKAVVGGQVVLGVKPTNMVIAKGVSGLLSCSNQIHAKICSCDTGILLSSVKLTVNEVVFESIITEKSSKAMDLKAGDDVMVMIKASDISILEIL